MIAELSIRTRPDLKTRKWISVVIAAKSCHTNQGYIRAGSYISGHLHENTNRDTSIVSAETEIEYILKPMLEIGTTEKLVEVELH